MKRKLLNYKEFIKNGIEIHTTLQSHIVYVSINNVVHYKNDIELEL